MSDFRRVAVGEITLRVALQGRGPLVVMVHGFPESWYSWRHQMAPIASAGFTACAIDVRGYGGSDKPHEVEAYSLERLSGDVAGLIAALSPDQPAVVIGHDWGAPVAWTTALVHPDRVRAVAGLSVPHIGIPERSIREVIENFYTSKGRFFYQHSFAAEGVAEAEFEADVRGGLRRFYYAWSGDAPAEAWPADKRAGDPVLLRVPDPDPFPAWLTDADIDYTSASSSSPAFGDRSTATAIMIGISTSCRVSRGAALNNRRYSSAGSRIESSSCLETSCPPCGPHCRTCGASICFPAAAPGPSRSGGRR